MRYDIFISYRRSSADTANLIAEKLRRRGYRVFFDVESLRGGKFNQQLFSVIDKCKDFVLVLPPNALNRSYDENDWVRLEVTKAMANGKNIIPIMLQGFEWPDPMPSGLEELKHYQAVTATSHEYFDMLVDRLCSYLISRVHTKIRRFLFSLVKIIIAFIFCLLVLFAVFKQSVVPACTEVAEKLTLRMEMADELGIRNQEIMQIWTDFKNNKISGNELRNVVEMRENEVLHMSKISQIYGIKLSSLQKFLMNLYGIENGALGIIESFYKKQIDEYKSNLKLLRTAANDKNVNSEHTKVIDANLQAFQHNINMGYYSYLQVMSSLPQKSQTSFLKVVDNLNTVPKETGLNQSKEEYNKLLQHEVREMQRLLDEGIQSCDGENPVDSQIAKNIKNTVPDFVLEIQNDTTEKDTSENVEEEAVVSMERNIDESIVSGTPADSAIEKNKNFRVLELLHMVEVKGGTFMMGHNGKNNDAKHEVTLSGFYIGKFEVTQKLWSLVMDSNPSMYKGDMLPVDNVSYDDIQVFLKKVRHLTGKEYRLPTEAEWEYVARGGNYGNEYEYSGGDIISEVAWYDDNANGKTHMVGAKSPNELGVYDMTGNVSEWCYDWYDEGYYNRSEKVNPLGPDFGITRVIRGGSFNYTRKNCRVYIRSNSIPSYRHVTYGFRLALSKNKNY